ncbi:MAG: proline dehydrogenase [Chitinophagaceae bacterium]|nr:MAG: proline dehydrogenase [Chitinophagaceae bacterium]
MISFDNTQYAFEYKSLDELKKARFLFGAMGNPTLLKIGLAATPLAIKWNIPFTKWLLRSTIFQQFVGGETLEQTAVVANKLEQYNVKVILDYGVEGGADGEEGFEASTNEFIKVINYAATQNNIPFMSIKVTGFVRFGLLEKIDADMHSISGSLINRYNEAVNQLPTAEKKEWQLCVSRLKRICETASAKNIGVLVDAEETWIQDPVDAMTMLMMDEYNKQKAVVFNTLQLYRHDRLAFLKDSYAASRERNFILGAKLVRGAYMENERKRAAEKGYPSPIQPTKEACDKDYNLATEYCITHLENLSVIIASHNEKSNLLATELLDSRSLPHNHPNIHFSQLYGMSDHITFNLAKSGCSVSKYLPFGPIKDVIPYLMRRAQENSSVAGQTGRELSLLTKELKRRNALR